MNSRVMKDAEPLPGYRLIERLGRGGYGEVWKAEVPGGLFKAIKFVYGDLEVAGGDNKAAEQELKALNRVKTIRHPFILSIERFDIIAGQLMIVMELADRNLWDRFQECRSQGLQGLPREELLRYMDEAAEALDLMNIHHQIQHLDIKPQNLFLVHNHVKVADFGLAKDFEGIRATVTGGVTPVYAAPETFEGWISRFSDQYSFAIVYQELLTGIRPFSGTNTRQLLMQHLSATPDVSSLAPNERDAVRRALSKKPDERFATCSEFVKAIRAGGNSAEVSARTPAKAVSSPSVETARTIPNFRPRNASATALPSPTSVNPPPTIRPPMPRGLPKLVTPGTAVSPNRSASTASNVQSTPIAVTLQRGAASETGKISRLGIAPPEKHGSGVLLPVYVVGLGKIGLQVLQSLRCHLYERHGRGGFPHWKWLFIDTDAETIQSATAITEKPSFNSEEVFHARMHRPAHYLKREGLPPPETWMNNEILYRLPREPATGGIRCLGRLALLDHYLGLSQKIRFDLETFLNDDVLIEADRLTGLGIRGNRPRVYIVTSLAGGTGSGMLLDLAYVIRNEMRQMGFLQPRLTGVFLVPPADRTAPKNLALANTCASLAELHHYGHPENCYETLLDNRQPAVADPERPFENCVLLSLPRTASSQSSPSADRAAGLIYQETLTPLGRGIDDARTAHQSKIAPEQMPLRTIGCFRITWPRQRMLETISERLAERTVQQWCSNETEPVRAVVAEWFEDHWRKSQLDPAALAGILEAAVSDRLGEPCETLIEVELQRLSSEAPVGANVDLSEIAMAIDRILQLVGKPGREEEFAPGKLTKLLESVARPITKESEIKFAKLAVHFVERPRLRLAAAEEAIHVCTARLSSLIVELELEGSQLQHELEEEYLRFVPLLGSLSQTGFMKSASRKSNAADLIQLLRSWPRRRLTYLLKRTVVSIYRQMMGNAPEYLREVSVCRQHLTGAANRIGKLMAASAKIGPTLDQPILPLGCKNLLEASDRFIANIPAEAQMEFELGLQQQVRRQFRALVTVGLSFAELGPRFIELLIEQSRAFVDSRLGQHSPAEEFFRNRPDAQAAQREIFHAYDEATPEPFGPAPPVDAQTFILGVSADSDGQRLKHLIQELMPDLALADVPMSNEIALYREYGGLSISDLPQASAVAAEAIASVKTVDRINPHTRTDVHWKSFLRE